MRTIEKRIEKLERAAGVGGCEYHVVIDRHGDHDAAIAAWAEAEGVTLGPNDRVVVVELVSPRRDQPGDASLAALPGHDTQAETPARQSRPAETHDRPARRPWMA